MARSDNYKFRTGFTLIEVIIATGLFMGFVTTVFYIYTSGTRSINSGSWKLSEQKAAQQFLAEWVKDIERSTPAVFRIASSGALITDGPPTPIYVNSDFYSTGAPQRRRIDNTTWRCLMAFSVTKPYQEANATFSFPIQRGKWTGISVFGKSRQIQYIRKDSVAQWTNTPISWSGIFALPVPPSGVSTGGDFEPSGDRIQERTVTSSMEELSINATGTPVSLIEIRAKFLRYEGGQPAKPPVSFEEVVSVKVSSGTTIQTFVH